MRHVRSVVSRIGMMPVFVAGALSLVATSPAAAETLFSAMPPIAVGAGLASGESGPLGLGALVGATVAAGAALRERFKRG